MDLDKDWRIGRFIEHYDFDYKNLNEGACRDALPTPPCGPWHVCWNFDVSGRDKRSDRAL